MQTVQGNALEWEGGSIDDLVAMLAAPALAVRVEVRTPAAGKPRKVGEIHMVAGGVYETIAGELRGDDAMEHLRGVSPLSFRLQPRLPNPDDGGLLIPGPSEGTLAERPPAELMRYCELYVLTCVLEIWRDTDRASISYGKGEIGTTIVNGAEGSERLSEVINWDSGGYRIVLPELSLPEPQKPVPKSAPAPQPARTMFGYPAAGSASQPVAVQTASPRATPAAEMAAAGVASAAHSSTEVQQVSVPTAVAEVAPVVAAPVAQATNAPAPAAGSIETKAKETKAAPEEQQAPSPKVVGRDPKPAEASKPAPTKAETKQEARRKTEQRKTEQRKTEQRKTEQRPTPAPEPRKTTKSKIPEKAGELVAPPAVATPKKPDGSIWSAIALGLAVGLACAAIYWIIRATGG